MHHKVQRRTFKLARVSFLPTPIVVVHGTGSCGGAMETYVAPFRAQFPADQAHWLFPTFQIPYHFLLPDADAQLLQLLDEAQMRGECAGRIIMLGHSGGAQFAHRFALAHPQRVGAAICLAAGCWTNPKGESYGMMIEENWFERAPWDAPAIGEALRKPASGDWSGIEWIVGCSDADLQPRRDSARRFHGDVGSAHPFFEWSGGHTMPAGDDAQRLMSKLRELLETLREVQGFSSA